MTFYAHSPFCPPLEGVNKNKGVVITSYAIGEGDDMCKPDKALVSAVSRKQQQASKRGNRIRHMVSIWYPHGIRMAWSQYNIPILHPYQCRS